MQQTISLTKTDITTVITSGKAVHSELGQELIDRLKSELGIEAVACFFDSYKQLVFEVPRRKLFFFSSAPKKHKFINYAHLTVYANPCKDSFSEQTKDEIYRIFLDMLREHKIELEYPRMLSAEEISFYGFQNKPKSEWNKDLIIPCNDAAENIFCVEVEDFVTLASYHALSNSCKALCRNKTLSYYNAGVFYGWDESKGIPRHYIIVFRDTYLKELRKKIREDNLVDEMFETVKKHDKCDIITKNSYKPKFAVWGDLSEEKRFELMRG